MADWIPIVSQVKSLVQVITGDAEGAERTQINFSRQCPVVSQARSAAEAIAGDTDAAEKTQLAFVENVSSTVDGIPVVGHGKGAIHYLCGDKKGGDNAMEAASRSTGVVAGAAGGLFVGGLVGAVAGGIAGGAAVDGITTGVDSAVYGKFKPAGYVKHVDNIVQSPGDGGAWFDAAYDVASDGTGNKTETSERR